MQPNPSPTNNTICNTKEASSFSTPADFKSRSFKGFDFFVCSLIVKLDFIGICAHSTDAVVIVIYKSWLGKFAINKDISIDGYNIHTVYRADRTNS